MNVIDTVLSYDSNKNSKAYNAMNECDGLLGTFRRTQSIFEKVKTGLFLGYQSLLVCAYSLCEVGIRSLFHNYNRKKLVRQIESDLKLLSNSEKKIEELARQIIAQETLFKGYNKDQVEMAVKIAMATYATTAKFYAPIVEIWSRSLLIRAKRENLQLVFLARDGNAPFEMAKKLQSLNPEFSDIPLRYLYFSRKVIENSSKDVLQQYLRQESVIDSTKEVRKQRFIDIGFFGSMIAKIQEAVGSCVPFEFLISTSNRAHGFVGNLKSVLPSIISAGKNRGVYWLEATHQGVIESPSKLVEDMNKRLVPNTIVEGKTCRIKSELDYLCKKIAGQALSDYSCTEQKITDDKTRSYEVIDEKLRNEFDSFLTEMKRNRVLYVNNE
jgi:hypothetical protein